jgi:hypothetical protein
LGGAGGGGGYGAGGYFASVSGDSFLSEVDNNIKKIKEIVLDARKSSLSLQVKAEYTKCTFLSHHHITRQSCDKSERRDNYVFDNMAKFKYLETKSYNFISE